MDPVDLLIFSTLSTAFLSAGLAGILRRWHLVPTVLCVVIGFACAVPVLNSVYGRPTDPERAVWTREPAPALHPCWDPSCMVA